MPPATDLPHSVWFVHPVVLGGLDGLQYLHHFTKGSPTDSTQAFELTIRKRF